jgi:hypothetical protein
VAGRSPAGHCLHQRALADLTSAETTRVSSSASSTSGRSVVSLRVLRDPVLALVASNEALAAPPAGADDAAALECLGRVIETTQRDDRIPSVERRRHRRELDVVRVDPAGRLASHARGNLTCSHLTA